MITKFNSLAMEQKPFLYAEKNYLTDKKESMQHYLNEVSDHYDQQRSPNEKAAVEKLNELAILLI